MPIQFGNGSEGEKISWSSAKSFGTPKMKLDLQNIDWEFRNWSFVKSILLIKIYYFSCLKFHWNNQRSVMKLVLIALLIAILNQELSHGQVFGPSKDTKDKVNPYAQ